MIATWLTKIDWSAPLVCVQGGLVLVWKSTVHLARIATEAERLEKRGNSNGCSWKI